MKNKISMKLGVFLAVFVMLFSMFSMTALASETVKLNYGTSGKQINVVATIPYDDDADYTEVTFTSNKNILYVTSSEGKQAVNDTTANVSLKSGTSTVTFALEGISNCNCNIKVTYMDNSGSNIKSLSNSISPIFTGNTPNDLQNNSSSSGSQSNPNHIISGSPNVVTQKETTTARVQNNSTNRNTTTTKQETTTAKAETETTTEVTEKETTTVAENANAVSTTANNNETTTVQNNTNKDSNKDTDKDKNYYSTILIVLLLLIALAIVGIIVIIAVSTKKGKKKTAVKNAPQTQQIPNANNQTAPKTVEPIIINNQKKSSYTAPVEPTIPTEEKPATDNNGVNGNPVNVNVPIGNGPVNSPNGPINNIPQGQQPLYPPVSNSGSVDAQPKSKNGKKNKNRK